MRSKTLDPARAVNSRWMMERRRDTGILPIAAIKAWSDELGMAAGPVRTPLLQMSDLERQTLRDEIAAVDIRASQPLSATG